MNTNWEEDWLIIPDKLQEGWGGMDWPLLENFEKNFRICFTTSEKNNLYLNLAMINLY